MEEILERQLLIRGYTFVKFSTIEKVIAGRMRPSARVLRRPAIRVIRWQLNALAFL